MVGQNIVPVEELLKVRSKLYRFEELPPRVQERLDGMPVFQPKQKYQEFASMAPRVYFPDDALLAGEGRFLQNAGGIGFSDKLYLLNSHEVSPFETLPGLGFKYLKQTLKYKLPSKYNPKKHGRVGAQTSGGHIFMPQEALDIVLSHDDGAVDYVELDLVEEHKGEKLGKYYMVDVTRIIDGIDLDRSVVKWVVHDNTSLRKLKTSDGRRYAIEKYISIAVKEDLPENIHLFRDVSCPKLHIFISRELASALESVGIAPYGFVELGATERTLEMKPRYLEINFS